MFLRIKYYFHFFLVGKCVFLYFIFYFEEKKILKKQLPNKALCSSYSLLFGGVGFPPQALIYVSTSY